VRSIGVKRPNVGEVKRGGRAVGDSLEKDLAKRRGKRPNGRGKRQLECSAGGHSNKAGRTILGDGCAKKPEGGNAIVVQNRNSRSPYEKNKKNISQQQKNNCRGYPAGRSRSREPTSPEFLLQKT